MAALDLPRPFACRLLSSLRARITQVWRHRQERAELLSLDERELRDIGLSRYDALMETRRRFRE